MMHSLSVCFPSFQDCAEAVETVASIRATAGHNVEIICIDDGDDKPAFPDSYAVKYHKNARRIGTGASRYLGVSKASGSHVLLCDSHMRFPQGWYEIAMRNITERPNTVFCGSMVAMEAQHMTFDNHRGLYFGGTFVFNGSENGKPKIMEVVWQQDHGGDAYEIPAVMGAQYLVPRDFYLKIAPNRYFRGWGMDEESLSLKTWLAGGEIRLLRNLKIGHRFRNKNERPQYSIKRHELIYNKLFLIMTCLPREYQEKLISKFKQDGDYKMAMALIRNDAHIIEVEKSHNRQIFTVQFADFLAKFGLAC